MSNHSVLVIPTRIPYFALQATATCAALRKESRMQIIKTTGLDRKSGGAKPRDLQCASPRRKNLYLELLSSTSYFFAAASIRFHAALRSASVTPST